MNNLSDSLIDRPEYVAKLYAWKAKTDLVKIVTGVRRCGKSKLFSLFQAKIMAEDNVKANQIININLEDLLQIREIGLEFDEQKFLVNYDKLLDYILCCILTIGLQLLGKLEKKLKSLLKTHKPILSLARKGLF